MDRWRRRRSLITAAGSKLTFTSTLAVALLAASASAAVESAAEPTTEYGAAQPCTDSYGSENRQALYDPDAGAALLASYTQEPSWKADWGIRILANRNGARVRLVMPHKSWGVDDSATTARERVRERAFPREFAEEISALLREDVLSRVFVVRYDDIIFDGTGYVFSADGQTCAHSVTFLTNRGFQWTKLFDELRTYVLRPSDSGEKQVRRALNEVKASPRQKPSEEALDL